MGADLIEHATGEHSRAVYLKGDTSWNKLAYNGTVTTYTDTTHFATTDLTGFGNDYFNNWYVYVVRDAGGAGAAPQGEQQQVSDYVSATGTFTHPVFTVPLAVGDEVMLILDKVAVSGIKNTDAEIRDGVWADSTKANGADVGTILADTVQIADGSLPASPVLNSLARFIASGGTALGTPLPASKSLYDVIALDRLDNATYGLSAIETYVDKIDDATNGLTAIKAEVEGIGGVAMRGTDSAALASVCTEARLAHLTQDVTVGIKSGVQRTVVFKMVDDTDFATPETAITVTEEISKDGGAFAACTNAFAEIANGWYKIILTATEMTASEIILKCTGTGCAQCDRLIITEA